MPETTNLIKILSDQFPAYNFKPGRKYSFRPPSTIFYGSEDAEKADLLLLHELAHALIEKYDYKTDIERIHIELSAWNKTAELCKQYHVAYDEAFVDEELDSYRTWLHQKSKCKKCGLTRYQTPDGIYHCPHCDN